jgi:hypothetical protein
LSTNRRPAPAMTSANAPRRSGIRLCGDPCGSTRVPWRRSAHRRRVVFTATIHGTDRGAWREAAHPPSIKSDHAFPADEDTEGALPPIVRYGTSRRRTVRKNPRDPSGHD